METAIKLFQNNYARNRLAPTRLGFAHLEGMECCDCTRSADIPILILLLPALDPLEKPAQFFVNQTKRSTTPTASENSFMLVGENTAHTVGAEEASSVCWLTASA